MYYVNKGNLLCIEVSEVFCTSDNVLHKDHLIRMGGEIVQFMKEFYLTTISLNLQSASSGKMLKLPYLRCSTVWHLVVTAGFSLFIQFLDGIIFIPIYIILYNHYILLYSYTSF